MCPLRFECVPEVVPHVLALGNNCENRLTVKQHLAVFFDVVGVPVPYVHAKDRELGEQSGFTRSSIEFPSVRETRQKADLCWAKSSSFKRLTVFRARLCSSKTAKIRSAG
jgi:hypothetical protein